MSARVEVRGVPAYVAVERLLGPGPWARVEGVWSADLPREVAADVAERLRGVGLGLGPLQVVVRPRLKRSAVRAARTRAARDRRDTTPGFLRSGARTDPEGRWSLTPEAIALDLARGAGAATVLDATCGVGGFAIAFARAGARVVAVEPDRTRRSCARHNAELYGVLDRIELVDARAEEVLGQVAAELVVVDPPWGVDWDRGRTGLADLPLLEALLPGLSAYPRAWLKVPPSFDPSEVPGARARACFGRAPGDRHRVKFTLLERSS